MDDLMRLLGLVNSFRIDGLRGQANTTSGARLNLDAQLQALHLTAADGSDPGMTLSLGGLGAWGLKLPLANDPSVSVDPYIGQLRLDVDERFFARAADFAREPILAQFYRVINRIQMDELRMKVRLTGERVAHIDLEVGRLTLQYDDLELIRVLGLSLTVLDYDTRKPPAIAQKEATVVLRGMRLEVEQAFLARVLGALKARLPRQLERFDIELPGPLMVVDGVLKAGLSVSFRVDLKLDTENNMFGITFERFYVPGTNVKLPSFARNALLSLIRTPAEKKLRGLVEISNESVRINPWSRIPLTLHKQVKAFRVEDGRILMEFELPGADFPTAQDKGRGLDPGTLNATAPVLAPGPALGF